MWKRSVMSLVLVMTPCLSAADWSQWRGPQQDGCCQEIGFWQTRPEGGPKLLWSMNGAGLGYAGVSISDGKLYLRHADVIQCYDVRV